MKRGNDNIFGNGEEILFGVIVLVSFVIPHTSTLLLLVNPLLCLLLFLKKKDKSIQLFGLIPVAAVLMSFLLNVSGEADSKSALTAVTIMLYIIAFPFVENVKLKNTYIYLCFGVIFLSQVCYMFHIGWAIQLIEKYYPMSWGERMITYANEHVTIRNFSLFRLGGLYHNPNQCAKYITLLMAIFLVNNKNKQISKQSLFLVLSFIGIMMTGSRTGFVVAATLMLMSYWTNGKMSKPIKILSIFAILVYVVYSIIQGSSSRSLDIVDGLDGSLFAKAKLVLYYLKTETSALALIFGHLDLQLFQSPFTYSLDCEYGYILYCYGFVGLISFAIYYFQLYKRIESSDRFFMFFLLWMLTSSVFMAYRTSFVFMLVCSSIYNRQNSFVKS